MEKVTSIVSRVLFVIAFVLAGLAVWEKIANMFGLDARLASVVWLWNTLLFFAVPLPVILWRFA